MNKVSKRPELKNIIKPISKERKFLMKRFPCFSKTGRRAMKIKFIEIQKDKIHSRILGEYGENIAKSLNGKESDEYMMLEGFLLEHYSNKIPTFFEEYCLENNLKRDFNIACIKAYQESVDENLKYFMRQEWLHFDYFYQKIFESFNAMKEFNEEHPSLVATQYKNSTKEKAVHVTNKLIEKYMEYKSYFGASIDDANTLLFKIKSFMEENSLTHKDIRKNTSTGNFDISLIA